MIQIWQWILFLIEAMLNNGWVFISIVIVSAIAIYIYKSELETNKQKELENEYITAYQKMFIDEVRNIEIQREAQKHVDKENIPETKKKKQDTTDTKKIIKETKTGNILVCSCGKTFQSRSGLWKCQQKHKE